MKTPTSADENFQPFELIERIEPFERFPFKDLVKTPTSADENFQPFELIERIEPLERFPFKDW